MLAAAESTCRSCPEPDALSAFYLGKLPPEALQNIAGHIDSCATCQAALQVQENQVDELLTQLRTGGDQEPFIDEQACLEALERLQRLSPGQERPAQGGDDRAFPERVGPYRLVRKLGQGAMGSVHEAVHTRLKRTVALKILAPRWVGVPVALARFHREMEAVGRLDHPHIVRAIDAGEADGIVYLAMELVEGMDLSRLVAALGPLPVADACALVCQAARGLQHAADRGIIHRDVKPSNLILGTSGQLKILDLGLVHFHDECPEEPDLTASGQVVGTCDYMAPEQGDPALSVDVRADVYSLGCTLYFLLSGRPPFSGPQHRTFWSKLHAHAREVVPPLRDARPDVSPELGAIVESLMAKDPGARPGSAAATEAALAPFAVGADLKRLLSLADGSEKHQVPPKASEYVARGEIPAGRSLRIGRRGVAWAAALVLVGGLVLAAKVFLANDRPLDGPDSLAEGYPETHPATVASASGQDRNRELPSGPLVYPAALFAFENRDHVAADLGNKVSDLLFGRLATNPALYLVDRNDLAKVFAEANLSLSGAVKPAEATMVGQLTGAKILITGSVVHADRRVYLVAKLISTETSRALAASVDGKADDELATLVDKLADKISKVILRQAETLVAKPIPKVNRLDVLRGKLGKAVRPSATIQIAERHVGGATNDPAAQTEFTLFCKETGFEVLDADAAGVGKAEIVLTGEGFSEVAARHGNLVTVKARLEVKAVEHKTGRTLAADRQTSVAVDLSEQLAGKDALQEAAAELAERLLPKLVRDAQHQGD
jgi:serine/threonine protein kinase/TolB-like protein